MINVSYCNLYVSEITCTFQIVCNLKCNCIKGFRNLHIIIVQCLKKKCIQFLLTYSSFIIDTIYNVRYTVTFCYIVRHVQILILIWFLLSKELLKIMITHCVWKWHIFSTFLYLHNCSYYKKNYIQFFPDIF